MAKKKKKKVNIEHYTHDAKRKNNPPAQISGEGNVPKIEKAKYAYSPHLDPVLRFDSTGKSDVIEELLANAKERPLSSTELETLRLATSQHQPWLEWTEKQEEHDRGLFEVDPVALHIHERISANAIMHSARRKDVERSLFADPEMDYKEAIQFYQHDMNWANRLILGDSLQVMSSLAQRENMTGKVQMIYMDPPYGINYSSNFQPEVGKRDVKEKDDYLPRELEIVKAYRDTWNLGLHSYISYLRDRLIVARELLSNTGSIFIQISDQNLHRVTQLLDEVFGADNYLATINWRSMTPLGQKGMAKNYDYLVWYAKNHEDVFVQPLFVPTKCQEEPEYCYVAEPGDGVRKLSSEDRLTEEYQERIFKRSVLTSSGYTPSCTFPFEYKGKKFQPLSGKSWRTTPSGIDRLIKAERLVVLGKNPYFRQYFSDFGHRHMENSWHDTAAGFSDPKVYVVQTHEKIIQRCMLMTTKPGDLVLDPTCGGGTTAVVAEHWGRRWITADTSRVAIALSRQRLMTKTHPYFKLKKDSTFPCVGFELKSLPHIQLGRDIAQNVELDPIFEKYKKIINDNLISLNSSLGALSNSSRATLVKKLASKVLNEGMRAVTDADLRRFLLPTTSKLDFIQIFSKCKKLSQKQLEKYFESMPKENKFEHWQVPFDTDPDWPQELQDAVIAYRKAWLEKMDEVNACIAANAEQEVLVDQPEVVPNVVRVSGPFTVEGVMPAELSLLEEGLFAGGPESLIDENGNGIPDIIDNSPEMHNTHAYLEGMCKHIEKDGVKFLNNQQQQFARLDALFGDGSGSPIHAEAVWKTGEASEQENEATVAIAFGPQYGPVTAMQVEDLIHAARGNGYKELVVAGFSFDPESTAVMSELTAGKLQVHLAHIRPDINPGMDGLLKDTANSELFTVFGLPDVSITKIDDEYQVTLDGVSIYDPIKSVVYATKSEKVAAWFLDSDYDGRCFCITQAFFPDQDAWGKLAKALKDVIEPDDFAAFKGTTSLPFEEGKYKKIAIKVIDPRGNEVMVVKRLSEVSDG